MKTIKRKRKKKKIKSKSKHKLQRKRRTHRRRKILRGGTYTYDDLEDAKLWTEFTAISRDDMEYLYELFFLYRNDKGILEKAYTMVKKYRTKGYKYDGRIIVYTEGEGFADFNELDGFTVAKMQYKKPEFYEAHAEKLSDKKLVEITFKNLKITEKEREDARASARLPYTKYSEKDVKNLVDSFAGGGSAADARREWRNVEPVAPADYNSDTSSRGSGRESGGGTLVDLRKKIKKSKRRTKRRYKY